jgi:hypothetical protein
LFSSQLDRLLSKAQTLNSKAAEAHQKTAYIADSVETFAKGFGAILGRDSIEGDELELTIGTGFEVGSSLEATLDRINDDIWGLTESIDLSLPVFSTSSSSVVATCNSLAIGATTLRYRPCPFLNDSDEATYANRLDEADRSLGNTYRAAWNAFYAEPHDPGRPALWQMRQVYAQLCRRQTSIRMKPCSDWA